MEKGEGEEDINLILNTFNSKMSHIMNMDGKILKPIRGHLCSVTVKPTPTDDVNDDGFITVDNRKAKGKNNVNNQKCTFAGVKVNNAKKTFTWEPVKKPKDQKNGMEDQNNGIKLKNLFEKLQDQEDDICIASCGETSGCNTMTKDSQCNEDIDSEVEETFVETNPYIVNPKGASTPSNDVSNVYVCAILESHVDLSSLSNVCKKLGFTDSTLGMFKLTARGYPWVLMGDFNAAINMEDVYAGASSLNATMCEFKDCVSKIEVADINSSGLHYTWNQKPKGGNGILKKLDRIMGNIDFMDCFPGAFVVFQTYRIFDHAPAVLKLPSVTASKPKPFKLFNFLAHKSNFLGLVEGKWSTEVGGHNMFQVQKALDSNPADSILREEESVYLQAFNDAKLDEERFLKQKAKVDWLEAGDSNSAYFHKTVKSNNNRSRIEVIRNLANEEVSGSHVPDVFVSHYEQFLGSSLACVELNTEDLFVKMISDISALNMVREVTNKEIKTAMFDIGDDKALGPDGFTSTFFKKSWHIVGNDVCNAVRDFFNNGCLLKEINHTFLALIPKVSTPLKVNDYRHISCCNVIYKCISKILANRVIEGIKDVVSDNQSAFIPRRRILDNILVTQELMHNYHNHRGPPRCAFKIDIQNAYDTVDCAFLENILGCFGFPNAMIRWIMACVSSTSFSFCINGNTHGYFKGNRGLRQGDPLSPYLFTMVMEVLTLILKKRVRNLNLFRYHKQCEELEIINVCFADDLFIFARGDVNSARVILESLEEFKLASGLVPSLPKSTAYFNIMPFSEGDLPVTYLGVPFISSRLLNKDCKILVEKAKNRIRDWRNKSLSFGIIYDIQQLIRGFLWCNGEYKRGKAKVAWEDICLPKDANGGLSRFSVVKVWEAIRPRGTHVDWFRIVWFPHAIPWHSFNLWLIVRNSLKTQDCMRQWDVGNDVDLNLLRMELVPPVLPDIMAYIKPMQHKRTVKSIFGKLVLAASACFIWNERNDWPFKKVKKSLEDIRDHIMITLRLKILSLRFKDTVMLLSVKVFHWRFGARKGFIGLAGSFFYV
ncbi:protein LAZ1 [Tanacetum coccineum]